VFDGTTRITLTVRDGQTRHKLEPIHVHGTILIPESETRPVDPPLPVPEPVVSEPKEEVPEEFWLGALAAQWAESGDEPTSDPPRASLSAEPHRSRTPPVRPSHAPSSAPQPSPGHEAPWPGGAGMKGRRPVRGHGKRTDDVPQRCIGARPTRNAVAKTSPTPRRPVRGTPAWSRIEQTEVEVSSLGQVGLERNHVHRPAPRLEVFEDLVQVQCWRTGM
jgi:hypothetical protein